MKSAHRHQLETNVLAQRLEGYIERCRPYTSMILGVIVALAVAFLIWSFISSTSAARRSEAWNSYNNAVLASPSRFFSPSTLDDIHRAAQDYPGTRMQEVADVTWADGQVYTASLNYFIKRTAAMDALERAASAYQGVIQTSKDEHLINRSRLGLARIYEMQNHLDKARDEYQQVTGAYANYAQEQAKRLAKPDVQETYTWLASAQLPQPKAPNGPGTPGKSPQFSPGDISLPNGASSGTGNAGGKASGDAFDTLFKTLQNESQKSDAAKESKSDTHAGNAESKPAEKTPAVPAPEKSAK
ncbi:MAG TPA: hypothetical protein VHE81_05860 [Lacipirellulaceae bacterium]|nr:hypothetical protein [Lacipirellulaceae bacterium]